MDKLVEILHKVKNPKKINEALLRVLPDHQFFLNQTFYELQPGIEIVLQFIELCSGLGDARVAQLVCRYIQDQIITIEKAAHWLSKVIIEMNLSSLEKVADNMLFIDDVRLKSILNCMIKNSEFGESELVYTIILLGLLASETKKILLETSILELLASDSLIILLYSMSDTNAEKIASDKIIRWYHKITASNSRTNKRHFLHFLRCLYYYTKNPTVEKLLDEDKTRKVFDKNKLWLAKEFDIIQQKKNFTITTDFNVCFIAGGGSCGTTAIIERFILNQFRADDDHWTDIGGEHHYCEFDYNNKKHRLSILDMPGYVEEYSSLLDEQLRGSQIQTFVFIFTIRSRETFEGMQKVFECVLRARDIKPDLVKKIPMVVVGSKLDLEPEREVSYVEAKQYADSIGIPYIECSAKEDINIKSIFTTLVNEVVKVNEEFPSQLQTVKQKFPKSEKFLLDFFRKQQKGHSFETIKLAVYGAVRAGREDLVQ